MEYYYSPYVYYLLITDSEEKATMVYGNQFLQVQVPQIGPRPPYYTEPVYEPVLPIM
ncbi:hypothetical protein [Sporosarcina ureae]|uniref:hypothetical protein n=1 Tax=Sporosarcina ureae TaxID=1571 RepID=UPI001431048C|nr:hypothetical protein [Sporosarcina ureae]